MNARQQHAAVHRLISQLQSVASSWRDRAGDERELAQALRRAGLVELQEQADELADQVDVQLALDEEREALVSDREQQLSPRRDTREADHGR